MKIRFVLINYVFYERSAPSGACLAGLARGASEVSGRAARAESASTLESITCGQRETRSSRRVIESDVGRDHM
jgi:plasmid replication initiation protein